MPGVAAQPMPGPPVNQPETASRPAPVSAPLVSPFGQAGSRNPAAPAAVLQQGRGGQFRLGLFSLGVGYEIGALNNIEDQINAISNDLENQAPIAINVTGATTPDEAISMAKSQVVTQINSSPILKGINNVLTSLGEEGNVALSANGHIPLTPFAFSIEALGGAIVVDAQFNFLANLSVVSSPLSSISESDIVVTPNGGGFDASFNYDPSNNDSTMLVKAALIKQLGLGYSHNVWKSDLPADSWRSGGLTLGGRLKYYEVELGRTAVKLTDDGDAKDAFDSDLDTVKSTGLGLDLGAQWTSRHYTLGAWVNNLNSPKFKFNKLDLSGYTDSKVRGELQAGETYTMKPQLQFAGALHSASQHWVLDLTADANAVQDPIGREYQWFAVNAGYVTNAFWIPGPRVGYRANLAGTQLSYVTAGLTWFGVSLDLAYGLQKIEYDGKNYPQSVMLNLSS
ncbi:conjugal transfer protein TraF, partial [Leptospira sp. 96542]|nr:conjugal transfer protein TraF [Leptospira sp. 96542]